MGYQETLRGIPGKTGLTSREWRFLNRFSEPDSPLWKEQLKKIDQLRGKYPGESPAQRDLDVFDPRTGVCERNEDIFNRVLELHRKGDIQGVEKLMEQLGQLSNKSQ